jgi:pyruvate/2-oxoglutarate dehydrogenase complex dihydrolipoamide acyltransferase (E2) component
LREQEQTKSQAVGKLLRGKGEDVLDDEPVGLRGIQLVVPRRSITTRDIGFAVTVSIVAAGLAVTAFSLFANTQPASEPQLASASATRVVDAAPADGPTGPAAARPAATELTAAPPTPAAPPAPSPPATLPAAAATPPTQKVSALAPADTRSPATGPQASELAMSPEQHQAMASLVARGQKLLRNGDFSSARLILERAADAGDADAALTLGSTYDPTVLARLGIRERVANVDSARTWYEKAQEFGSTEASSRLKALPNR